MTVPAAALSVVPSIVPLDNAHPPPITLLSFGMPSRRGSNSADKIHHRAQQRGSTPADKSFTSAIDFSRPTALRRRGSDGGTPRPRDSSKLSHYAKSRTIDSTSELHPLRRSSSTIETARYDIGSTRPRLSRALSSSSPVRARPDPPPEKAESHRTVLAHEVWHRISCARRCSWCLLSPRIRRSRRTIPSPALH